MKKFGLMIALILASNSDAQISADSALVLLQQGNQRFVEGKAIKPNQSIERLKEVSASQKPFAIIVGCSDSRVPNEIIFDQGLGDLFIVRTAGQVSTYASYGSIEFGEAVLGAKLIVVLGHTKCGAVVAACNATEVTGHILTLVNEIKPAAEQAKKEAHTKDEILNKAIAYNVLLEVEKLRKLDPILAKANQNGEIKIVGAVYNLETGKVEFIDEAALKAEMQN